MDSFKAMWVRYERMDLPHFRNNTNNRLESFFGKVKQRVNRNLSMHKCIQALIELSTSMEDQYNSKHHRVGTHWNATYNEELNAVIMVLTDWGTEQLMPKYESAVNATYEFIFAEALGGCIHAQRRHGASTFTVNPLSSQQQLDAILFLHSIKKICSAG